MSAAPKLFPNADPVWGYLRPAMLTELLATVERSAELARDELLSTTDHVEYDGASGVLYALGEVHKVLRAAHELRDSFECSAFKKCLEAEAQRAREMADDEPSIGDVEEAEASDVHATDDVAENVVLASVATTFESNSEPLTTSPKPKTAKPVASDADDPVALARSMQQKRHGGS